MKNVLTNGVAKLGLLAVMTIIAASVSANAQSLNYRLTANIPFDFSVAGEKLPAGKYWINRAPVSTGDAVIQIQNTDGHKSIARLTIPVSTVDPAKDSSLVFHRYGDQYFLSEIWPAGGQTGRVLPKTRAEKELERKAQETGVAQLRTPELQLHLVTIRTSNLP